MKLFVKEANRFKFDNLTPGMTYDIGMATVMNGNLSELVTIQQTLSENQIFFIHNRYLPIWGYCRIFRHTPLVTGFTFLSRLLIWLSNGCPGPGVACIRLLKMLNA